MNKPIELIYTKWMSPAHCPMREKRFATIEEAKVFIEDVVAKSGTKFPVQCWTIRMNGNTLASSK